MTTPTAYISHPRILIAGQAEADLSENLLALLVEETWEGLYRCECTFNAFGAQNNRMGFLFLDREALDFGSDIVLELGADERRIFEGRVTALEASYPEGGGAQLTALAEDRLQDLRMTRRTRSFADMSDRDIIERIARDHSLTPEVDISGPTHRALAQVNQSDLAFVRQCARRVDAEVWVEGNTLYASTRQSRAAEPVVLEYGVGLLSFGVSADLAHQCTRLTVSGWDVANKSAIAEEAGESAISEELNGDTGGSAVLDQAFGPRPQSIVHRVPLTTEEARSLAEACYRERARRFVRGSGTTEGNADVRVGAKLDLSGLGPLFSGHYYVTRVRHTFDALAGFRTAFEVERPGIGA
jgi:phage protein D